MNLVSKLYLQGGRNEPSSGIHFSGPRYTYVLNNPLKYTDPSGYKKLDAYELQELRESEAVYYEMMSVINEWNDRLYNRKGGGGGPGGYGERISTMHKNPYEWSYNSSVRGYRNRRTGQVIDYRVPLDAALNYMGYGTDDVVRDREEIKAYIFWNTSMFNMSYSVGDLMESLSKDSYKFGLLASLDDEPKQRWRLISHPRGYNDYYNSWQNFWIRVEELDQKLDGGVYEDDDPSNEVAQALLRTTSELLPTSAVMNNLHRIFYNTDPFTGQVLEPSEVQQAYFGIIIDISPIPSQVNPYIQVIDYFGLPFDE